MISSSSASTSSLAPSSTFTSPPPLWGYLLSLNSSKPFLGLLRKVMASRDNVESAVKLRSDEAVQVVDVLDRALDSNCIDDQLAKKCLVMLRRMCGVCGILPTSHMVLKGLEIAGERPLASGGFADMWPGIYHGQKVAIKALRIYATDDLSKISARFFKEAVIWKRLSHPNVLPLLGISTGVFRFCMVSSWMAHGNIVVYVDAHKETNRFSLLLDVTNGLQYLHSLDLVHCDLKGANILINENCRACLTDFGLLKIISDPGFMTASSTTSTTGTTRWMAPELLNPEAYGLNNSTFSKESDVYALGMVIYEVLTCNVPFHKARDWAIIHKVISGIRPSKPADAVLLGLSDVIWNMLETCWRGEQIARPSIQVILDLLNDASAKWIQSSYYIPLTVDTEPDEPEDVMSQYDSDASDAWSIANGSLVASGSSIASEDGNGTPHRLLHRAPTPTPYAHENGRGNNKSKWKRSVKVLSRRTPIPDTSDREKDQEKSRSNRKRRIFTACTQCRRRKIRCDNNRPACANCLRRSSPCQFD